MKKLKNVKAPLLLIMAHGESCALFLVFVSYNKEKRKL